MAKLARCIGLVNGTDLNLSEEDQAALRESAFGLESEGQKTDEAERLAVKQFLDGLMGERQGITDQVAAKGGVAPRRSERRIDVLVEGFEPPPPPPGTIPESLKDALEVQIEAGAVSGTQLKRFLRDFHKIPSAKVSEEQIQEAQGMIGTIMEERVQTRVTEGGGTDQEIFNDLAREYETQPTGVTPAPITFLAGMRGETVIVHPTTETIDPVRFEGFKLSQSDHLASAQKLESLPDDGSATLVLEATNSPGEKTFLNWLYSRYNVTGHFEIGENVAGTPTRMISIEGRRDEPADTRPPESFDRVNSWDEVYTRYTEGAPVEEIPEAPKVEPEPIRFSVDKTGTPGKMSKVEVEDAVRASWVEMKGAPGNKLRVQVISTDELPEQIRGLTEGGKIKAAIQQSGEIALVTIVYDAQQDAKSVRISMAHEVLGHFGVTNLLKNDWSALQADYQGMKQRGGKAFNDLHEELTKRYGELDETAELQEFIALAAERRVKAGAVGRFIIKAREFLNKALKSMGFKRAFSVTDIHAILSQAERGLQDPGVYKGDLRFQRVYHGSPHTFDKFSTAKIGTGEGAQAYGHGLYFTSKEEIAEFYRDQLSGKAGDFTRRIDDAYRHAATDFRNNKYSKEDALEGMRQAYPDADPADLLEAWERSDPGKLYTAEIPDESLMLDWDKPLSEQSQGIKKALEKAGLYDPTARARIDEIDRLKGELAKDRLPNNSMREESRWHELSREAEVLQKRSPDTTGMGLYQGLARQMTGNAHAEGDFAAGVSRRFKEAGIPGITYMGPTSGERNYVVFDEAAIEIIARAQIKEEDYTDSQKAAIRRGGFGLKQRSRFKRTIDRINEAKRLGGLKLRQGVVDQFASIKTILNDERAWMMAHLTASNTGAIEASLEYGQLFLDNSGAVRVDTSKKSLKETLEPLGGDVDRFLYWIAGNRANRLAAEDREHLFEDEHITSLMSLNENTRSSPNREQLFNEVLADFEGFSDSIVQIGVETGLINAEEAEQWKEEGFYLPFYRVMTDDQQARGPRSIGKGGLVRQEAFKRLKGGTEQLDDLLGNMLMNWNHLVGASLKNQAATHALDQAVEMGLATEANAAEKDAVFVRVDGEQRYYTLDDSPEGALVLDSLLALNWQGLNGPMMKGMRAMKRALTFGVTLSPEFKIANLMRDSIQAVAVADMSTNIAKNLYQGFAATKEGREEKAQLLAGGGTFAESGYIHGADPDAIRYLVKKGVERNTILDSRKLVRKMFDAYQDFGSRLENVNRAANYVQALAAGKDQLLANFEARDHLDFARTGSFTTIRALAQTVPFLNARLQGLDKLGRAAMDENQRKQFTTVVGTYALLSVMLYLSMRDDEDYKAAEDWERDTYHLFKIPGSDVMYRFPRPFEVGAIGTMAERIVEQMVDDDAHGELFAERVAHTLGETFSFNPVPAAIRPALEVAQNKSWFTGRSIESLSMKNLSAAERKRAWTSETAIAWSQVMDKVSWGKVVLSPVQIDHLVRGYLGWLGATALGGSDYLVRGISGAPEDPDMRITEFPVIRRFARSGPARNTKYTTLFYERLGKITEAYADIRQARKLGEGEKVAAIKEESAEILRLRRLFEKAQDRLSKINNRMVQIQISTKMTGAEKRKELDRLQLQKNEITKRISEKTAEAF